MSSFGCKVDPKSAEYARYKAAMEAGAGHQFGDAVLMMLARSSYATRNGMGFTGAQTIAAPYTTVRVR